MDLDLDLDLEGGSSSWRANLIPSNPIYHSFRFHYHWPFGLLWAQADNLFAHQGILKFPKKKKQQVQLISIQIRCPVINCILGLFALSTPPNKMPINRRSTRSGKLVQPAHQHPSPIRNLWRIGQMATFSQIWIAKLLKFKYTNSQIISTSAYRISRDIKQHFYNGFKQLFDLYLHLYFYFYKLKYKLDSLK